MIEFALKLNNNQELISRTVLQKLQNLPLFNGFEKIFADILLYINKEEVVNVILEKVKDPLYIEILNKIFKQSDDELKKLLVTTIKNNVNENAEEIINIIKQKGTKDFVELLESSNSRTTS